MKPENIIDKIKRIQLFVKRRDYRKNKVPYGDRSNSIIEPFLTEQWFCDMQKLSIKAKKIVKNKKQISFPSNWSKTYFQWMNNIEPWWINDNFGGDIKSQRGMDQIKIFVAENQKQKSRQKIL